LDDGEKVSRLEHIEAYVNRFGGTISLPDQVPVLLNMIGLDSELDSDNRFCNGGSEDGGALTIDVSSVEALLGISVVSQGCIKLLGNDDNDCGSC